MENHYNKKDEIKTQNPLIFFLPWKEFQIYKFNCFPLSVFCGANRNILIKFILKLLQINDS